jgi:cysteine-rich repeat protein
MAHRLTRFALSLAIIIVLTCAVLKMLPTPPVTVLGNDRVEREHEATHNQTAPWLPAIELVVSSSEPSGPLRRQGAEGSRADCGLRWCGGPYCIRDSVEKNGAAVCGDGTPCKQVPLGCEICPPPLFAPGTEEITLQTVLQDLPMLEPQMKVFGFDGTVGASVEIRRADESSICTLLCFTISETKQSGLDAGAESLPRYPLECGPNRPCGHIQNECIDLSAPGKKYVMLPQFESHIIRARLFSLPERASSAESAIYLLDTRSLTRSVQCGDGYTVSREYNTSAMDIEGCDDGNFLLFDGCDEHCVVEAGFFTECSLSCCIARCFKHKTANYVHSKNTNVPRTLSHPPTQPFAFTHT